MVRPTIRPAPPQKLENVDEEDETFYKRNQRDFPDYVHKADPFASRTHQKLNGKVADLQHRNTFAKKQYLQKLL